MDLMREFDPEKECSLPAATCRRRSHGLVLTHDCNLRCTYCYVGQKTPQVMPFDVAQAAIGRVWQRAAEFEEVEIDFMGGEPLLEFGLMRRIAEWMWGRTWAKPYVLFATTNGTLLDANKKQWFFENRERIILGLSFDGTASMQDFNRSRSSTLVDIPFFRGTWPAQPVKMTISNESVANLAEGVMALHEMGFGVHANPAHGIVWTEEAISQFSRQLARLADYYCLHRQMARCSLFNIDLSMVLMKHARSEGKYCGAGTVFSVTDIDGHDYPCHMFSPLVLPEVRLQGLVSLAMHDSRTLEDAKCVHCVLTELCPTCYGVNFLRSGNPALRDPAHCRMYVIQILANCRLHAQLLAMSDTRSEKDRATALAVSHIQRLLQTNCA